jgi:hypothetical protein
MAGTGSPANHAAVAATWTDFAQIAQIITVVGTLQTQVTTLQTQVAALQALVPGST